MRTELKEILIWLISGCAFCAGVSIIVLGFLIVMNFFVIEVLLRYLLKLLRVYAYFARFIVYRRRFKAWFDKYEGGYEPGAND